MRHWFVLLFWAMSPASCADIGTFGKNSKSIWSFDLSNQGGKADSSEGVNACGVGFILDDISPIHLLMLCRSLRCLLTYLRVRSAGSSFHSLPQKRLELMSLSICSLAMTFSLHM